MARPYATPASAPDVDVARAEGPVDVVHVLPHARTLGGTERAVLDLLGSPELAGVAQRVVFVQAGDAVAFPPQTVLRVKSRLPHPLAAARTIAGARPRVIHGWLLQGNFVGALGQVLSPTSRLLASERNVGDVLTFAKRPLERFVATRESLATANSEAVRSAALRRIPSRARAMRLVSPGVPPPARPARVMATDVVMVGRLDPVKGYENALRAWAKLTRERPRGRLTIVGDGSQRPSLESLSGSLGVRETVEFVGDVDPGPYLFGARVFLQSSRAEGFSRALLEALMAGLPAVTTDVGGVREISAGVVHIVPKEDREALAGALRLLLADSGAADRARGEAHLVSSQFELSRCCRDYREIYRELGVA